ncbi:hypothetical protein CR159_20325 [Pollutimonas subterranea]|uniref:Tyr recombinase domain-containing protein n=1 Tax=Pollutimonas subterranea TaxID=2045210 RepID=A0A2N4TZ46_9BURK|nr:site-specific integrase [Pollutimonas subterranea]PLC48035.1 hypothetical protein CR159_20325 [Pollutimonas subterranea]
MAKPFIEGCGWAFRLRTQGQDIYRGGYPSEAAARKAQAAIVAELEQSGKTAGLGPHATTLAMAFSDYARQRLPALKGAKTDVNRINRYLRASGLPLARVARPHNYEIGQNAGCHWVVSFQPPGEQRIVPSLTAHRHAQAARTARTNQVRDRLARTRMADVRPIDVQQLIDAMIADGYGAATIDHERAELRRLFSYARKTWQWSRPAVNPASPVKAPPVDNARTRVLTNAEWERVSAALAAYDNPYVIPLLCLMLETAMRSCEPLTYACWGDVNWSRRVLQLGDGKTGKRDVPLSPDAILVLEQLAQRQASCAPQAPIFPTSYEAIKKAWSVARLAAGVPDVQLHDLRHTSATRYALQYNGNMPVIKLITGHKTTKMAMRYVNLTADHVVHLMHGGTLGVEQMPAGYQCSLLGAKTTDVTAPVAPASVALPEGRPLVEITSAASPETSAARRAHDNVVRVNFARRVA